MDAITAAATTHLRREEGVVAHAYADSLGFLTIGVGRLIDQRKGGKLSNDEIDYLLANDIATARRSLESNPALSAAWAAVKDDPIRATALISMRFQLGEKGLAGFKNTLAMIARRDFAEAAANALKSLWARQTPERAKRVTAMLATGKPA